MSASTRYLRLPFVACLLLTAAGTQAATYTVGASAGCTHSTISAAFSSAQGTPGPDVIRVTRDQSYTQQAIDFWILQGDELTLTGGFASCFSDFSDGIHTVLDGAGGAARPVLKINNTGGAVVRIQYLTLRGGDSDGKGGGIHFAGEGSLHLANSALINNTANLGGGLYAEGYDGGAVTEVFIHSNVTISGNVARVNGGGVFAEGVILHMAAPNSLIAFNHAEGGTVLGVPVGGYGGGLVINPKSGENALAYIGGTGVGNLGIIHGNSARYGGGIAVLGETGIYDYAFLYLYTTDPARPVAVRDNFASIAGGGLHVQPRQFHVYASLWNAYLDGNSAPDGAAVYLGSAGGRGYMSINRSMPADAAPCPTGVACGAIRFNRAEDANGQPTDGAVIRMAEDSEFYVTEGFNLPPDTGNPGLVMHGNQGGRLFELESGFSHLFLRNVLIEGNTLSHELIRAQDEPQVAIVDSTIAGNVIGAGHVLAVSDELIVKRSILWQPGKTSLVCSGCSRLVEWTLASEVGSLGGGPGAVLAAPRFNDPARGDFRLRAASPAVDYAPPMAGDDRDLLNVLRDQRLPQVPRPDPSRTRDSGAFERSSVQPLVLNGQFAGDLNLWTPHNNPAVYSTDNAPSSAAGTGSAFVGGTSTSPTMYGAFHCVHLPGPGTYRLNGWSHSSGALPSERNPVALRWEFRPNGGEGCIDGMVTASGEPLLHSGSSWGQPPAPAYIHIPEAGWTNNNTLTVVLAVHRNGSNNSFNGWFDNINLEFGSDLIFANNFEL